MARLPKPWYRAERKAWFVIVNGVQHNLSPDKKDAQRRFHELMREPAGRDELKQRITSALSEFDKDAIISLVCDTALRWPDVCRHIFIQAELNQPLSGLVGDVRSAITKAKLVPEKMLNHNFPIDYEAFRKHLLTIRKARGCQDQGIIVANLKSLDDLKS